MQTIKQLPKVPNGLQEAAAIRIAPLTKNRVMPTIEIPSGHPTAAADRDAMEIMSGTNNAGATAPNIHSFPVATPGAAARLARWNALGKISIFDC